MIKKCVIILSLFTCILCTNIFSNKISFSWHDSENWSNGSPPYLHDDVEISKNSMVILYYKNETTMVNNIIVSKNVIFEIYSPLKINNNFVITGEVKIFYDLFVNYVILKSGMVWLMNDANIYCKFPIIVGNNDYFLIGPYTKSYIGTTIENYGNLTILPNSKLSVDVLNNQNFGQLNIYYGSSYNDSHDVLISKLIYLKNKMTLSCVGEKYPNSCVPLVVSNNIAINENFSVIDTCNNLKNYTISNNQLIVCF